MFSAVIGKIGVTLGKTISSFKKGMEDELSKDDKEESKTEKENNVN